MVILRGELAAWLGLASAAVGGLGGPSLCSVCVCARGCLSVCFDTFCHVHFEGS